jgi:hypothetical protein
MHTQNFWNQTKVNNLITLDVYGNTFRYLFVILLINAADVIVIITLTQLFLLIILATGMENEKLDMKQKILSYIFTLG